MRTCEFILPQNTNSGGKSAIMKKKILVLSLICMMILNTILVPASAATSNPYGTTSQGCITNITMKSSTLLGGDVQYFTSSVTSKRSGTGAENAFDTYGAIGGKNSKLFVYSMGKNNDTDFTTKTVKTLMQNFAAENPDWIPLVAINGDFFDIETGNTPGIGEPEGPMIQNGDVLKAHMMDVMGCGVVGIKEDGTPIFHVNGFSSMSTYTEPNRYNITVSDSTNSTVLAEYAKTFADRAPNASKPTFVTPDSEAVNLTGMNVYVVSCDTYRYAYRGGTGHVADNGEHTYFFDGKITSVREGVANDKPAAGTVLVAVHPSMTSPIAVGTYVKANAALGNNWANVENAFGFKQAVLVNGDSEFVKGSSPSTNYVADTSYANYNANRTAIGFKKDGTPVLLAIAKTGGKGQTYYEIAEQLKALGCVNGFVLDGGGSTTMIISDGNGNYTNAFVGENGSTGRSVGNVIILAIPKNGTVNPPVGGEETTEAPTEKPTEAPTTEVPTEAPTTEVPTEAPTTEVPTEAPTTEVPTEAPTTEDPTTEAPTEAPTTEPSTEAPTTEAPTEAPVTEAPTAEAPEQNVTEAPTAAPVTDNSGCGSTIGGISAIIISLTVAIPFFKKKKRK